MPKVLESMPVRFLYVPARIIASPVDIRRTTVIYGIPTGKDKHRAKLKI